MVDEVYIHKMPEFAGDQFHGYVDIGTGETDNTLATRALVLMVVAVNAYVYMHPSNPFVIGLTGQSDWKTLI